MSTDTQTQVPPEQRPLTLRQRKFIKEYIRTGNGALAARLAGYSPNSAAPISSENLTKPNIQAVIKQALAKYDLSIDSSLVPIADAFKANKQLLIPKSGTVQEYPDHPTRLKAAELALKLNGVDVNSGVNRTKERQSPSSVHQHLHIESGSANLESLLAGKQTVDIQAEPQSDTKETQPIDAN